MYSPTIRKELDGSSLAPKSTGAMIAKPNEQIDAFILYLLCFFSQGALVEVLLGKHLYTIGNRGSQHETTACSYTEDLQVNWAVAVNTKGAKLLNCAPTSA